MTLEEKFLMGQIKIGDSVFGYKPNRRQIIINKEKNGLENTIFQTEETGGYRLAVVAKQFVLVGNSRTKQKLIFRGEVGYNNSSEILKKVADCYSSKQFHATGICLKKEDYFSLPRNIRKKMGMFWVDNPEEIKRVEGNVEYVLRYICTETANNAVMYNSYGDQYRCPMSYWPAVVIPGDVQIDKGNKIEPFD